jgi:endoglucanase
MIIKKIWFYLFLIFTLLLTACAGGSGSRPPAAVSQITAPSVPDTVRDHPLEPVSGKIVSDYFRDERIRVGWNLGNSLDSHNGGIGGETTWGNPQINQELLNGVKAAGFDIIRIPITWMGYIGAAPDHKITPSRLQRAAEVAEMAHNAGLKAIINLHHDGSTQGGGRDNGWISIGRASRNTEQYNLITTQYIRVWQQIAAYFKNYGDWLIFEGFNELHDGNWQTCSDPGQFIALNNWNQFFVDIVRSSGGNNESRFLMVNAYCADNRQALSPGFMLPNDPSPDRLILSFHYYAPHELAINGSRSTWGTDTDRQRVDSDFAPFKGAFIDKNIPVIIGECGAVMQLYPDDAAREAQARQSRTDYITHVFSTAKKYGLVPVYWDNGAIRGNGEKFGLFDRRTGQPNSPDSDALIKLMIRAVR